MEECGSKLRKGIFLLPGRRMAMAVVDMSDGLTQTM